MTLTNLLRAAFATKPRRKAHCRLRVEALEGRWCPAGGQLDTTFGGTGSVSLPYATMRLHGETVVQPDGKTVTVGAAGTPTNQAAIVRLNVNGSLDTSFNGTGRVVLPLKVGATSLGPNCTCVALQPDGKILVGIWANKSADAYFAAARFNANGSLDTTFGNNAGYWFFNPQPGTTSYEHVRRLALLPGGGVIAAGDGKAADGYQGYAVVKLTASGQTDAAFGSGGMTVVHVGTSAFSTATGYLGVAVTPAGGVVLAGGATQAGATGGLLVVLTPGGQLDAGFNGSGILVAPSVPGTPNRYNAVAVQGSSILVAGLTGVPGSYTDGLVARYTLSGALDTSFGVGGYYINHATDSIQYKQFTDIKVASDGSIVAAGSITYKDAGGVTHQGFQVAHLSSDGAADAGFGPDGTGFVTVLDVVTQGGTHSLAIGPDGKILFAAVTNLGGGSAHPTYFRYTAW
ncbi:MAG: delta-60 repeat domain-containing protein [Gemmataceae bacterium]